MNRFSNIGLRDFLNQFFRDFFHFAKYWIGSTCHLEQVQCILINAECYEVGIYICRMNFHSSIQNIIYKNLHYCWTRWTQNNKNLCIECVGNLVHIWRLFPHHPRGKSHWRIVFFLSGCSPIGISFHLNNYFWCFRYLYSWWNEDSFDLNYFILSLRDN